MVQYNPLQPLPTDEELPDSDGKPVDNELHVLIPALLRSILALLWAERTDWFFGANMGVYYDPKQPPLVPDAFLSLGVDRNRRAPQLRLSYVLWQENDIVPQWVLEIVSQTPGGEYDAKMAKYAELGMLYYLVYNPNYTGRDRHERFELYRLTGETYERVQGSPVWMPELELGIGYETGRFEGRTQEWLYWYDRQGQRFATPEEAAESQKRLADQQQQRAEQERQRAERLAARLRAMGVEPDEN
ncbi:Uma2 family endonuclease [Gloeobacter morelensis]|uniref:Uma2 family endonuclease n=1 Tax=Gloeobacter morelensis MG652769 TaxID=2781736 RepID=A0ABY3PK43_9CYAN|nr:Uma2 family endonuclease [Gloeobacter morelensis]UFP93998.1 Uma2 family endonuclease [Gloeobacter morelensis MG652769]